MLFLNIAVICAIFEYSRHSRAIFEYSRHSRAIFSSFGNLFCFMDSLMQFVRSLKICLSTSFMILVGIATRVFVVGSSKYMILQMS